MVNTDALRGKIVENRMTLQSVAKSIGISDATMTRRMRDKVFGSDEIEKMIDVLNIDSPEEVERIFFAK